MSPVRFYLGKPVPPLKKQKQNKKMGIGQDEMENEMMMKIHILLVYLPFKIRGFFAFAFILFCIY